MGEAFHGDNLTFAVTNGYFTDLQPDPMPGLMVSFELVRRLLQTLQAEVRFFYHFPVDRIIGQKRGIMGEKLFLCIAHHVMDGGTDVCHDAVRAVGVEKVFATDVVHEVTVLFLTQP